MTDESPVDTLLEDRGSPDGSTSCDEFARHSTSISTSTLVQDPSEEYRGVPYEQFEAKVQRLCDLLWPKPVSEPQKSSAKRKRRRLLKGLHKTSSTLPSYKPKEFVLERMRGGGYNHVMGITLLGLSGEVEAQMVLRIPLLGTMPADQDVCNLQFVNEYINVPTAEIIAYDFSDHNPLNSPYCIQSRISGHDLESVKQSYPSLSQEQKLAFVEEFCEAILLGLQSVRYPWIGQINKIKDGYTVGPFEVGPESKETITQCAEQNNFFKVRPLGTDEIKVRQDPLTKLHMQTVLHFFEIQFGRYRNLEHYRAKFDPSQQWEETIWHRLVRVARQMDDLGYLETEDYCLTHYDLEPRNIMVEIESDGTPKISGIVDWDLVCFAPDWVGCKPPMWIWNWLDGGSEDETQANDDSNLTAEQKELKDLFDDLVGDDFRFNAYRPDYRIARSMFRFARYGLPNPDIRAEAERLCEEWEVMYQAKQAVLEEDEKDEAAELDEDASQDQDDDGQSSGSIKDEE